ncbi:hypothetical protein NHX12_029542, partial [Muraenolepis orangiensis]
MLAQGGQVALAVVSSLLLLWQQAASIEVPQDLKQPPTIVKESSKDYIVDPRDNITIECEAKGNPAPTFTWLRKGKVFNTGKDPRVKMRKRSGTLEINFRNGEAPLWPKELLEQVLVTEGQPLVLACNPPPGLPPPYTFWMNSGMIPIQQDKRVSMGLNGDLYFSNVLPKDGHMDYCCNARFLPTPSIQWFKKGGDLPAQKVKLENFNKTLQMASVSEEDAGDYVCMATSQTGSIRHTIHVQVKGAPYWLDMPINLVLAPDENGRLICRASGNPKPHVQWLVNGEPVERSPNNPSREMMGDTIIFHSVQSGSSSVYQCNASNQHGYLLANAFVSVLDMTPRILGPKNQLIKVIKNNRTFLDCPFFGSPLPELRWFKNGQGSGLDGGYYRVYINGTLEIKRARVEDQGTYTCVVSNILGAVENQVILEVKEPTRIIQGPENQSAKRGSAARLDCKVKSDPTMLVNVTWLKDDQPLSQAWRWRREDEALSIPDVQEGHAGVYTCLAASDIDQDVSSARLTVLEEVSYVPSVSSGLPAAFVSPGYLETTTAAPSQSSCYPGDLNSVILPLSPFINYQFQVIAINAVGQSAPSLPSPRFMTSAAAPDAVPRGLRGWGTKKNNMEITWEPLLNLERNGPNLRYMVWWRRKDTEDEWSDMTTVGTKHMVHHTDTYVPYQLKIQARNDLGSGPESNIALGYSGED